MNIRRVIAGVIAAFTAVSALAACGSSSEGGTSGKSSSVKEPSAVVNEIEEESSTDNTAHGTATNARRVTTTTTRRTTTTTSTTTTTTTQKTVIELQEIHLVDGSYFSIEDEGIKDSYGNTYVSNIAFLDASNNAWARYDLNGEYESFKAKLVTSEKTGSGAKMNFAVFADGKMMYSVTDMTRQKAPQEIDIDLKGVNTLEFKTTNSGSYSYGWLFLVESELKIAEMPLKTKEIHRLGELVVIDSSHYSNDNVLSRDSYGELHNGRQQFDATNKGFALYNLDKQYSTLSGKIVPSEETGSGASINIEIYADDELVYSCGGVTRQTKAIEFECNVSNAQTLKIVTSNLGERPYGYVWVVDDELE